MSLLTNVARAFLEGVGPIERRELQTQFPDLDTQVAAATRQNGTLPPYPRNYRLPSITEALGVPSVLSAVQLIAGTVGSLSMEAFQNGVLVTDRNQVPRVLQRPNPKTTPREFWRDTAFYLATRGEVWWYVAARDGDGNASALVVVPPWEVSITRNPDDRFSPLIVWLGKTRSTADLRQITYLPSYDLLHGVGPLQIARVAATVAIEADIWAANFFSGAYPTLIFGTDQDMDETELKALKKQYLETDGNLPRFMTNGLEPKDPPWDAQKAQLTDSRLFQVSEVARMFGIPGPLLEHQMRSSSMTYRNEADIWTQFINQSLNPHYLEPIQQEMSDLLTRSMLGKFNVDQLQRGDVLTRYQVYQLGLTTGMLSQDEARRQEGLAPGNVDYQAVPPSTPQATVNVPSLSRGAPLTVINPRCKGCGKQWALQATAPYKHLCSRCKTMNVAA